MPDEFPGDSPTPPCIAAAFRNRSNRSGNRESFRIVHGCRRCAPDVVHGCRRLFWRHIWVSNASLSSCRSAPGNPLEPSNACCRNSAFQRECFGPRSAAHPARKKQIINFSIKNSCHTTCARQLPFTHTAAMNTTGPRKTAKN